MGTQRGSEYRHNIEEKIQTPLGQLAILANIRTWQHPGQTSRSDCIKAHTSLEHNVILSRSNLQGPFAAVVDQGIFNIIDGLVVEAEEITHGHDDLCG